LGGPPQKTQDSISTEQYEKRLDAIRHENLSDPIIAYADLLFFIGTLPLHVKDKVEPEIQQVNFAVTTTLWQQSQMQERKKRVMSLFVLYFINKISALLHGQFEMKALERGKIGFDSFFLTWLEENKENISESVAEAVKRAFAKLPQAGDSKTD